MNQADWRTTSDAVEFLAEAGGYLRADPVENTVAVHGGPGGHQPRLPASAPVPAG